MESCEGVIEKKGENICEQIAQQRAQWFGNKWKLLFLFALLSSLIVFQYSFGVQNNIENFGKFGLGPADKTFKEATLVRACASLHAESVGTIPGYRPDGLNTSIQIIKPSHSPPVSSQRAMNTSSPKDILISSIATGAVYLPHNISAVPNMVPQSNLNLCPKIPPDLVGPMEVCFDYPSFAQLEELYPYLEPGGHGKPKVCRSRHRVAIIIPYRDREQQLRAFLHNLHSLLTKQQLDYAIFIVEPIANTTFNRAKLMNIGFKESSKVYDWQCYIFHDVDLLPQDDRNLYTCPEQPRHMSVAIDKFKYKLPYADLFGGISALTKEQFEKINGFPNDYWGWGSEDDDIARRVKSNGYKISRYPADIARYMMIKHVREKSNTINKCRHKLLWKTKRRMKSDGLNSLTYSVLNLTLGKLYTRLIVDLKESESRQKIEKEGLC